MAERDEDTPLERVRELLEEIADAYALEDDVNVAVEETEEGVRGSFDGDDLGLIIGRHGQTIDAIQDLAVRIAFRGSDERRRVVIDAAGYRDRRAEALEREADRAAGEALRYGRPVALDAMGAAERRLVHEYLRDRTDVETHSEGDEPDRHLVVAPVT